jgi:cytochrome c-type biogenesis protein CcmH/NrfF
MRRFQRLCLALALCCSATLLMGADVDKGRYEKLGGKMQCMCGCNQMLLKCNHVGCPVSPVMIRDLQASIKAKPQDEEVLNWFRHNYGITTVIEPATHGFELTIWVVPPVLFSLAVVLVVLTILSWRRHASPAVLNPELESMRERARRETEI